MKPTRKLLFVLCALLVLGFIYYSSWKLHLYVWGQNPRYDKQGFLLQLETKLPPELAYKYGNLSEGVCKPGYATAKMTSIYPKFVKLAPMFLDRNFKQHTKIKNYPPPFGIKTQGKEDLGLKRETSSGIGEPISSAVGLREWHRRMRAASISQWNQFGWKNRMEGFWKSVAQHVPRKPAEMRILNPYFIQEAAFQFIGLPFNNGLMGKGNIPTLGTVAITMALHNCDEVAVAGFGYDMTAPQAPLHYYESVKMSAIKESWTHNIAKEKEFLRKLVKANVITDLTKGI
uniref:ST3 beta-galactoside alpha-2,3-sialyltransferase 3b n=1 Tax=Xiphophorus couchianus TaxID=32473 RepID=A0A3B5LF90_9TELE